MENPLLLIDKIEQLVENGSGWMGKRFVNEEEFFTLIQQLRTALPQAMKNAKTSRGASQSVQEIVE
ncbi:MAG TPA: hypothetical protein VGB45_04555 [Abditibacterium sp.]|jgi:hypothetical protein